MVIGNQVLYKIATGSASDLFLAKFDSAGSFDWVRQYGNPVTNDMRGFGINILPQGVALTGIANQGADIGGFIFSNPIYPLAGAVPFVALHTFSGNVLWMTGIQNSSAVSMATGGITAVTNNKMAIAGFFGPTAVIGSDTISTNALLDMFIATLNNHGVFQSGIKITGTGSSNERPQCITSDTFGNVYVGGAFDGTLTVNGSSYTASGTSDGFVVKYGFNCTTGIEEESVAARHHDGLLVYPNPATDIIYISNTTGEIEKAELYNLLGEKISSQKATRSLSRMSFTISALPSGIYLVAVYKTNGERMAAKVMVQRE